MAHFPENEDADEIIEQRTAVLQNRHRGGARERLHGEIIVAGKLRIARDQLLEKEVLHKDGKRHACQQEQHIAAVEREGEEYEDEREEYRTLVEEERHHHQDYRQRPLLLEQEQNQTEHRQIDGDLLTPLERIP